MGEEWLKREDEEYRQYAYRLYKNRGLYGLSNDKIKDILNKEFNMDLGESTHRCKMAEYIKGFDIGFEKGNMVGEDKTFKNSLLTPKGHLNKIKDLTTEYEVKKRGFQLEKSELSKMMRIATPSILLSEQYLEFLNERELDLSTFKFDKIEHTNGKSYIKSLPSDWHIGAEIDEEYNFYNYDVAIQRMEKFTQKVIENARLYNATTIGITHMGDIIEGFNMRNPQKYFCEFTSAEQIVFAQELLMKHILTLHEEFNVELSFIHGNHERSEGNKKDAVEEDNFMYTIMENIKNIIKYTELLSGKKMERISFVQHDSKCKYHKEQIFGHKIRYQHGDDDVKNDERKIEKYNGVDNENYDILIFGHLHHYRCIRRNRNNLEIYCGCLQGSNHYGKYNIKSTANASQTLVVFKDNGEVIPIDVDLQD